MGNTLTGRPCYDVNIRLTGNNQGDNNKSISGDLKHYCGLVKRTRDCFAKISAYSGCTSLIRDCYKHNQKLNSSADAKSRCDAENSLITCFQKVAVNAEIVMDCYEIMVDMGFALKALSTGLFQENVEENNIVLLGDDSSGDFSESNSVHERSGSAAGGISVHQRISILTELVTFVLQFDLLKSTTPDIQNDYSYFKREVSSSRMQDLYSRGGSSLSNSKYVTDTPLISTVGMWLGESFPCSRHLRTNFQRTHAEDAIDNDHPSSSFTDDYYDAKHSESDTDHVHGRDACKPGYSLCPAIVTYGLIANIICCMFHRKHEYLFSQSNAAHVDVKNRYIKSMVCCAVLYDVLNSSGSSQSSNDLIDTVGRSKLFTTQSIFAPGSFVKTSKIIAVVNEYTSSVERNKLFNIIKFCSYTYNNKETKPNIMKLMDTNS